MRLLSSCLALLLVPIAFAKPGEAIVGEVRVQALSPTLVRLEQRGPKGFEDRVTFTVVEREWRGLPVKQVERDGAVLVQTKAYTVRIPKDAKSLAGIVVLNNSGKEIYRFKVESLKAAFLPAPGAMPAVHTVPDYPRLVPPSWGATPTPSGGSDPLGTSGWDPTNNAQDLYVFVTKPGRFADLRREVLRLTGPIPVPPLYSFGFVDSRYYRYSEQSALDVIDTYRRKGIPLDMFVVDTDWRVNGSHGYDIETKLFPDMERFIRAAHQRNVRLMYNDHPEPRSDVAFDPKELEYRWAGLTKMLGMGVDVWWYDRNWHTHLKEPMPGIAKEVWGMRMYADMTQRFRPGQRPLVMSNAEGINNGHLAGPPHPAGHRYPIWWTGDTGARWDYLVRGVTNGVRSGAVSLLPYVNEDLGGHWATPSPELYVRFLQYGSLSPMARVHCTLGETRYPWEYGAEAERIATDYIKLRYRLMPTIYEAARRCYEDGTPLLRRLDLYWPQYKEAADDTQYLLGEDLLVAPIIASVLPPASIIPGEFLRTPDGQPGLKAELYDNPRLEGTPKLTRIDKEINFLWGGNAPAPGMPSDNYSIRWTGTLGPVPVDGEYELVTQTDDGVRLWIDDQKIIDQWIPQPDTTLRKTIKLEKGKTYRIKFEYFEDKYDAMCHLRWIDPRLPKKTTAGRNVWVPPGRWSDLWTGRIVQGPKTIEVDAPLHQMPMYARQGGAIISVPEMQHTGERPWNRMTLDIFVGGNSTRRLYEDDGESNRYQGEGYASTYITTRSDPKGVDVEIGPRKGIYSGAPNLRSWLLRFHVPKNSALYKVVRHRAVKGKGPLEIPLPQGPGAPVAEDEIVVEVELPPASPLTKRKFRLGLP